MRDRVKAFLPYVAVAVLASGMTSGGPALAKAAFDARNAHKVDGLHAVGADASVNERAGRLVATAPRSGRLPNNIIAKAPDADRLDGKNASAFVAAPANQRFAIIYPLSNGTVGFMAIREDASVRDKSDPNATVTRVGKGRYCINAPGSREGAVGALQNMGDDAGGTIRVSMGIGSFCNNVTGTNITVETFSE